MVGIDPGLLYWLRCVLWDPESRRTDPCRRFRRLAEPDELLVASDQLFESGAEFASELVRAVAEGWIPGRFVRVDDDPFFRPDVSEPGPLPMAAPESESSWSSTYDPDRPWLWLRAPWMHLARMRTKSGRVLAEGLAPAAVSSFDSEGCARATFAHQEHLKRITHLSLTCRHRETLGRLAGLEALTHLRLRGQRFDADAVSAMARSTRLAPVTHLDLRRVLGPGGLRSLARSPSLKGLRSLGLAENPIDAEDLDVLLGTGDWARLVGLDLYGTGAGRLEIEALVRDDRAPRLRELRLGGWHVDRPGRGGSRGVATRSSVRSAWTSERFGTPIDRDDLALLASTRLASRLSRLDLSWRGIDAEAVRGLTEGDWTGLAELELRANPLGPEGVEALVTGGLFGQVEAIGLADTELGDRGIAALVRARPRRVPRRLDLSSNGITTQGLLDLLTGLDLRGVTHLGLAGNPIDGEGLAALAHAEDLVGLTHLDLRIKAPRFWSRALGIARSPGTTDGSGLEAGLLALAEATVLIRLERLGVVDAVLPDLQAIPELLAQMRRTDETIGGTQ